MLYPVNVAKIDIYADLKLSDLGLSNEVFQLALAGHQKLESAGQLENPPLSIFLNRAKISGCTLLTC